MNVALMPFLPLEKKPSVKGAVVDTKVADRQRESEGTVAAVQAKRKPADFYARRAEGCSRGKMLSNSRSRRKARRKGTPKANRAMVNRKKGEGRLAGDEPSFYG